MKRRVIWTIAAACVFAAPGCGGGNGTGEDADTTAVWFSSPEKVVEGLMHAYATRNDSLYAELLADEFRYYFEPPDADPADVLGWGKEEDLVATGNLFRTPDVEKLSLGLTAGEPRPAGDQGEPGWVMIPISGGELRVEVKDKDPMLVTLNRQEIYVRNDDSRWQVIQWRDYPEP